MRDYHNWTAWQKSMSLVVLVYKLTSQFPKEEMYGLSSQMRRAAVSIPSNIAEGCRRGSKKEESQFFKIAFASGGELETQLEITTQLQFGSAADNEKCAIILNEVMRLLNKMAFTPKNPSKVNR